MKIQYLYLKNYIGIYNGMGLKEIEIDFSKCKNNIVLIKGDNGSGKSTLFKAMTPFPDTSTSFIPNTEVVKTISYKTDNGDIISIQYNHIYKDSLKSSCHVFKNDIDLNPNGNITEAKDLIYTLFDLDYNFITLSQISSEDRGLADKKPSERKKFINAIIQSLAVYNEMYKKLSKKSSTLKSMISSINSKIASIGNIERLESEIKQLENELSNYENRKTFLLTSVSSNNVKLEALGGTEVLNNLKDLKSNIDDLSIRLESYNDCVDIDPEEIKLLIENNKAELSTIQAHNINVSHDIENINTRCTELNNNINEKSIKLSQYGDINKINEYKFLIEENIQKRDLYIQYFKDKNFNSADSVTEEEYSHALEIMNTVNQKLSVIYHIADMLDESYSNPIEYCISHEISNKDDLYSLQMESINIQKEIDKQNMYASMAIGYDKIPDTCNNKDICPFVKSIVENNKLYIGDKALQDLISKHEKLECDIKKAEINNINMDYLDKMKQNINFVLAMFKSNKSILAKFGINFKTDLVMQSYIMTRQSIQLDLSSLYEMRNSITLINSLNKEIEIYSDNVKSLSSNEDVINLIREDINKMKSEYNDLNTKRVILNEELKSLENSIIKISMELKLLEEKLNRYDIYSEYKNLFDSKSIEYKKYESNYLEMKVLDSENTSYMEELKHLNLEILPDLTDKLNNRKYQIVLYNDYAKEYNEFSAKYEKIELIKKYASPTSGIQTIFMNIYMNDIISTSNQLLGLLFGGQYVLHPFIINENEFRIPCSGEGLLNDDISSMSTSQICMISMIISFALLHKTSSIYNIIKLDEMDGGLDSSNRIGFITLLRNMMDIMQIEQCVMISHNAELDNKDVDLIVLKNSDPNPINGNIIFSYN